MNQATLDALRAIFEAEGSARTYYVVTPEGKHRLSPVRIESIDAQLNCTINATDAGSTIKSSVIAAVELYETPDEALAAFEDGQAEEHGIAVQNRDDWSKE